MFCVSKQSVSRLFMDKQNLKLIVFCILQKLLFEYVYSSIIYPSYNYYGFQHEFSIERYIISWILYLLVPFYNILSKRCETLSAQAIAFFINIVYLPSLILYVYMESTPFISLIVIYYFLMSIVTLYVNIPKIKLRFGSKQIDEKLIFGFGYAMGLIVFFVWAYYAKFHIQLSLLNVYEIRFAAREFSTPKVITYARCMARGVIPLLMIYSLYRRKMISLVYFFLVEVIQFFIDGSKTVVFFVVLGFLAYFFIEKHNQIISKICSKNCNKIS